MRRPHPVRLAILASFVVVATGGGAQRGDAPSGQVALVGGTIYRGPAEEPIRDGVVLVQNRTIAAVGSRSSVRIPPGTQTIDCTGLTITAGFWNSHVHFLQRKWANAATTAAAELDAQLQAMLTQYGFTSVFDTWSMWENTKKLRERIESGEIRGPRIRSTGEAVFGTGIGITPAQWASFGFIPLEGFKTPRVADAAEALAASRALVDAGVDAVKFYAATPGSKPSIVPESAIRAGVQEAHSRGKLVLAHPSSAEGLLASVRAGVDILTHSTPQSGPWDDSILAAMKGAKVALIPTLKLWQYEFRHERFSIADRFAGVARDQLRAWVGSGGVVLFGTDVGYMSEYDPSDEYTLMAAAGMNYRQILASLTTAPADRFGDSARLGRIAPGLTADLTVLKYDPSQDVRAFAAIALTVRDGQIIYRAPR